ncbi:54S ribosomal protein L36, mitochondrial [Madurella fahalii]|uniref:54S ribosomal protein L36, mitochondrial n=1 Tax=Madurella fahalii TaxID=1157608 RepID=A0ABQ0GAX4_9PEZI
MGKLPSTILRRPSLAVAGLSSPAGSQTAATAPLRTALPAPCTQSQAQAGQARHASFVARPRRPYTFTQLVQLSDGSTFTVRTTSPAALYKSAKDSRNHILWQPSEKSLRNLEVDEAGKLAAFRERYGNAWNLEAPSVPAQEAERQPEKKDAAAKEGEVQSKEADADNKKQAQAQSDRTAKPAATQLEDQFDSLVDLISMYATEDKNIAGGLSAKDQARKDKSGKKK